MIYPISECFVSPQGEGQYAGTLMIFLRLAGCTVGKRYPQNMYTDKLLPIYTNQCTTYDGRTFACDTDYRTKAKMSSDDIVQHLKFTHETCKVVCLTGGEPMFHDLRPLLKTLIANGYKVHMETSGTIPLTDDKLETIEMLTWVAVSPKLGFLDEYLDLGEDFKLVDELKILVGDSFMMSELPDSILQNLHLVFLQPINEEHTINKQNMQKCLELQLHYPQVRISSQSHKLWHTR